MLLSRRFLLTAASATSIATPSWARDLARGMFTHGVASGDPLQERVMIWTRFVPANEGGIGWEVAEDEAFARVAQRGVTIARFANDFCVKVDVGGLRPGRRYFYRFLSASGASETGRTLTAPAGGVERLTLALVSCANFPFGYFHAYGHIAAREDVDVVLHVGDYIYEIRRGSYPSAADTVPGRLVEPMQDTVTLSDYYQRYACYHTDRDLLELRRSKPICAVWDDHEIANDAWHAGAQAHNPDTQGAYADRAAAANKAYHDWMPIREVADRFRQYRSFNWGDLARIVMLDTRFIGRDQQLDFRAQLYDRIIQPGANADAVLAEFRRDFLDNPNRSLLGGPQERWLDQEMANSKQSGQTWQVLAQQVILGEWKFPANATSLLPGDVSQGSREWVERNQRFAELGLSWNQDAWGGYGAARTRFIESCTNNAANALVLAGDSHNCYVNNIPASTPGRRAAIEFAGGSVTSPGFERTLTGGEGGAREALFRDANPNMSYCDLGRRGFGVLALTREGCAADWIVTPNIRAPTPQPTQSVRLSAAAGQNAGPGAWTPS